MALLINPDDTYRIILPTDLPFVSEGDWIEIRPVWTADIRRRIGRRYTNLFPDQSPFDLNCYRQATLEEIIRAWSDPEPVSPDAIGQLHPRVQDYVQEEFDRLSAGRTEDEKKESASSSLVGPAPDAASSLKSLAT